MGLSYLSDSIASILNQSFSDFELIIIDDNSPALGCSEILKSYQASDARVQVMTSAERRGSGMSRNKAFQHVRGQYIALMDSDDISDLRRLEDQHHFLEGNSQVVACSVLHNQINQASLPIYSDSSVPAGMPAGVELLAVPSLMFNADLIRKIGPYRPFFRLAEDIDWIYRLKRQGAGICLPCKRYFYRAHRHNTSSPKMHLYVLAAEISDLCVQAGLPDPIDDISDTVYERRYTAEDNEADLWQVLSYFPRYFPDRINRLTKLAMRSIVDFCKRSQVDQAESFFEQLEKLVSSIASSRFSVLERIRWRHRVWRIKRLLRTARLQYEDLE